MTEPTPDVSVSGSGRDSMAANQVGRDMKNTRVLVILGDFGHWIFPVLTLIPLGAAFALGLPGSSAQMMRYLIPCGLALVAGSAVLSVRGGRRWLAVSAAVSLSIVSGLLLVHTWRHGDLDVTDRVHHSTSVSGLATGDQRTVTVDIPRPRAELAISFRLSESSENQICVPLTAIEVVTSGGYGGVEVQSGGIATIQLDRNWTSVSLKLTVRTDQGCQVDLHVGSAVLRDH
ncbi:hypothetical protein AB0I30_07985 [Nocardia tengchongensis]|uniref:hypothetical protein n=1 Tax=Nocardia tengchongensis TaxID=2055889 RepID=UPI0033D19977